MTDTQNTASTNELWETATTGLRIAAQMARGTSPYGKDANRIRSARNALDSLRTHMTELEQEHERLLRDGIAGRDTAYRRRDAAEAKLTKAEQERDEARWQIQELNRIALAFTKEATTWRQTAQYAEAKLEQMEAVVGAARRLYPIPPGQGRPETGALLDALAALDQEEAVATIEDAYAKRVTYGE